jgi:hypothetical protein
VGPQRQELQAQKKVRREGGWCGHPLFFALTKARAYRGSEAGVVALWASRDNEFSSTPMPGMRGLVLCSRKPGHRKGIMSSIARPVFIASPGSGR